MSILDFTVMTGAGNYEDLLKTGDVIMRALDKWAPPGCGPIDCVDTVARFPVDAFLAPQKYIRPLGFLLTVGAEVLT